MIIPYMSIDLFFVAAPFLCRSEQELYTLAKRITFAILMAGACFLLFPLRFAFERPPASGWLGVVFNAFRGFDQPFNLLPSLHIALRTILAVLYAQHTRGVLRLSSHIWFSLIGLSTVLTYQHHVVDVLGGFVLAAYCFYLFSDAPAKLPVMVNRQVGTYYVISAFVLGLATLLPGLWGLLLFWPALSLSIVAAAYFGWGPGIYRKANGRLPLSTRFVLGPMLLGQQLSLLYYRRQCRPWDEVVPGVWIGRKLNDTEAAEAVRRGVTAVLDLTAEFDEARPFLNVNYCNLAILDLTSPTQDQLQQIASFIAQHATTGIVYVHCKIGYSRSAAAVGSYLLSTGRAADMEEVVQRLRAARPSIIVRPEARAALSRFSSMAVV
jgi:protein-tyrosine phosphatase/membrane-associated phospholipid phosphatase